MLFSSAQQRAPVLDGGQQVGDAIGRLSNPRDCHGQMGVNVRNVHRRQRLHIQNRGLLCSIRNLDHAHRVASSPQHERLVALTAQVDRSVGGDREHRFGDFYCSALVEIGAAVIENGVHCNTVPVLVLLRAQSCDRRAPKAGWISC